MVDLYLCVNEDSGGASDKKKGGRMSLMMLGAKELREQLVRHAGHTIAVRYYTEGAALQPIPAGDILDVTLECEECSEVLLSTEEDDSGSLVAAVFVSVWDFCKEVRFPCFWNPQTDHAIEIQCVTDAPDDSSQAITSQYVELKDGSTIYVDSNYEDSYGIPSLAYRKKQETLHADG